MDNVEISVRKEKELNHFAWNPQLAHGATKGKNRGRRHKADKTKKDNVGPQSQQGSVHNSLFSCNKRPNFKNRFSFKRKRDEQPEEKNQSIHQGEPDKNPLKRQPGKHKGQEREEKAGY